MTTAYHLHLVNFQGEFALYFQPNNLTTHGKLVGYYVPDSVNSMFPRFFSLAVPLKDSRITVLQTWSNAVLPHTVNEWTEDLGLTFDDLVAHCRELYGSRPSPDLFLEALAQAYRSLREEKRAKTNESVTRRWLELLGYGAGRCLPALAREVAEDALCEVEIHKSLPNLKKYARA